MGSLVYIFSNFNPFHLHDVFQMLVSLVCFFDSACCLLFEIQVSGQRDL